MKFFHSREDRRAMYQHAPEPLKGLLFKYDGRPLPVIIGYLAHEVDELKKRVFTLEEQKKP